MISFWMHDLRLYLNKNSAGIDSSIIYSGLGRAWLFLDFAFVCWISQVATDYVILYSLSMISYLSHVTSCSLKVALVKNNLR